ncbi:MAG: DUF1292 domain-containing protein [Eubacterium sp.]|nr:DUF1292 domain-containing protein [Eubacterium sp.]MBR0118913.1 DUF1292 domain-containing protein [Eubacterium sp.]
MNNGSITLTDDDGAEVDFYILEETELGGETYLLVTDDDSDGEEAEALILREITDEDGMAVYETVEDESILSALSGVFEELLDEINIELE